jgi:protein-tyrosine phosphatase
MSESLRFSISKGCLALKGSLINDIAHKWQTRCSGDNFDQALAQRFLRDGEDYHMTIISAAELKALPVSGSSSSSAMAATLVQSLNSSSSSALSLYDLGVGCYKDQCYYIIVYAPFLQKTRLKLNLPPIDLHITLGFHGSDVHEVRKGIATLWVRGGAGAETVEFMQNIAHILQSKSSSVVREFLDYNRLAEMASQHGYLFGAYYLAKYQSDPLVACDILEQAINDDQHGKQIIISNNSGNIDYGALVCQALNHSLYSPLLYHRRVRRLYSSVLDINRYEISFVEMPRNFSFITETVAGSSLPDSRKALENLVAAGITDILTVMEGPLDSSHMTDLPLTFHWFEVNDRTPPTTQQMKEMMTICTNPDPTRKTLVHCMGGVGRTATVLAAYLMWSRGMSRQEAKQPLIDNRRTIISQSQDEFLTMWYSTCLDHKSTVEATSSRNSTSTSLLTPSPLPAGSTPTPPVNISDSKLSSVPPAPHVAVKFPPLLMCVGYPASGKSTFAEALCSSNPERFIRINQDESGRKQCEENISKLVKAANKTVILDRCNLTCVERKEWLGLAHNKKAWVIHFSTPIEECKWRIVRRVGHPTLKNGQGGRVIDSLAGSLEAPNPKTEKFEQYFDVHSFDACNELLRSWGCDSEPVSTIPDELGLLKFPRTRHLANLGSATRDDLLISKDDAATYFLNREVFVEEKIDGANMGLSIRDNRICAQNRSHYVTAEYHPQFKHLDKWIHQHSAVLWEILQSDRYILYGEWCYAKHSIPYAALSDWFTAFDMFDRLENKFWSRNRLESYLADTGISVIPLIAKGSFSNIEALKKLVQTKSQYYDGPVEGIVVRVNDGDDMFVESRGKIVRSDFLSGDTHWSKYGCNPNTLVRKCGY